MRLDTKMKDTNRTLRLTYLVNIKDDPACSVDVDSLVSAIEQHPSSLGGIKLGILLPGVGYGNVPPQRFTGQLIWTLESHKVQHLHL